MEETGYEDTEIEFCDSPPEEYWDDWENDYYGSNGTNHRRWRHELVGASQRRRRSGNSRDSISGCRDLREEGKKLISFHASDELFGPTSFQIR